MKGGSKDHSFTNIRAAIDIGSNSVKLLIAQVRGRVVDPIVERSQQTRLNRGLVQGGDLNDVAIRQTLQVVRRYIRECLEYKSSPPIIFATSALRKANRASVARLQYPLYREFGLSIQVISSMQEAKWAFKGVCSESSPDSLPKTQKKEALKHIQTGLVLVTDVGGGSAQFMLGIRGRCIWSKSCPLGAVHLLEQVTISDPPTIQEKENVLLQIRKEISDIRTEIQTNEDILTVIPDFSLKNLHWIGVGGAATIIASLCLGLRRFNRNRIESATLPAASIQAWVDKIWGMSLRERCSLRGLPSCRADITLPGTLVYLAIMQVFAFSELQISTRGGRYGALLK